MTKKLSEADAAYIAGIIDGEGHVFVSRVHTKNTKVGFLHRSGLSVSNTSFALLRWLKNTIGQGQITAKKKRRGDRQFWVYSLWSREASDLLEQLIPYLLVKEKHAFNQIAFQRGMTWYGSKGTPTKELHRREKYANRSYKLNQRGD